MENVFRGFKEQIERGVKNNIPRDARLIIIGQLLFAAERDELTLNELHELEAMVLKREEFQEALEYAISGELLNAPKEPIEFVIE